MFITLLVNYPHEICPVEGEEFDRYETSLLAEDDLDGIVDEMIQLLSSGQVPNFFLAEDGKLVLPDNYANTRLWWNSMLHFNKKPFNS